MERDASDRGSKWLIGHQAGAILTIGGARGFTSWRAAQAEVVAPKKLPDGLLEVFYPGSNEPDLYLVEISSYPERRAEEQAAADALLVFLDRGRLPEVLTLVLCPRGPLRVGSERAVESPHGWTRLRVNWRVVELWELSAGDLLALNDVGLVPWIPLTRWDGDPEALLRECRDRIDRQALPQEHDSLLAVTAMMGSLRYNKDVLLNIFGGGGAMLEFPLVTHFANKLANEARREDIGNVLAERFGALPPDLANSLRSIEDPGHLKELHTWALRCPDLDSFRARFAA